MSRTKRGTEYVDPEVQGALWRRLLLHWLAYTAVAVVLAMGLEWMNDPFRPVKEILITAWWNYGPLLLVLMCLMPVFVFDTIRMSHRFAGPVYRLRQVIHNLASGEKAERVEFRDNDFWKEIAADVNRLVDRLGDGHGKTEEPTT
jgi:hypothetical protein